MFIQKSPFEAHHHRPKQSLLSHYTCEKTLGTIRSIFSFSPPDRKWNLTGEKSPPEHDCIKDYIVSNEWTRFDGPIAENKVKLPFAMAFGYSQINEFIYTHVKLAILIIRYEIILNVDHFLKWWKPLCSGVWKGTRMPVIHCVMNLVPEYTFIWTFVL